ncbi:MAG: hypothetical protein ACHREM_18930, partial [Polyangiales bacterium]
DAPIDVELTFDGVMGGAGVDSVKAPASASRADLCKAIGSCTHGYSVPIPAALLDGKAHAVHAYGLAASGEGPNVELTKSSMTFTCAAPAVDAGAEDTGAIASDSGVAVADSGVASDAGESDAAAHSAPTLPPGAGSGAGCAVAGSAGRASMCPGVALLIAVVASRTRRRR